jgi:hypothetical protein
MTKKSFKAVIYTIFSFALLFPNYVFSQELENPLGEDTITAQQVVARIVQSILGITAAVALVFIILGAIRIAFAAGNEEMVSKGKKTLLFAIIGLIIAFAGFVVVERITFLGIFFF